MADKVKRIYTPGKNDFLHFANTMNKNVEIDLRRSGSALPAYNSSNIGRNFNNQISPTSALNEENNITTEVENITAPESEISDSSAATDVTEIYDTDGELLDEQAWYLKTGTDPDLDLQNTNSMLDYEYQTLMASYGENAERLYQMGLNNSGVSDIFQSNAFSSYLAAKNDAYAKYIDSKKKNKAAYNQYVTEYNEKQNTAIQYAITTYGPDYIEENELAIRQALKNSGMSSSSIDKAIQGMKDFQATLPEGQKAADKYWSDIIAQIEKHFGDTWEESAVQIQWLDEYLQNNGIIDKKQDVITYLNDKKTQRQDALVQDAITIIDNASDEEVSYDDLKQIVSNYENDKNVTESAKNRYSSAIVNAYSTITDIANIDTENYQETVDKMYVLVPGMSESTWKSLNVIQKENKLLEAAEQAKKEGLISNSAFTQLWVNRLNRYKNNIGFSTAINISNKLSDLEKNGYIDESIYQNLYSKLSESLLPQSVNFGAVNGTTDYLLTYETVAGEIKITMHDYQDYKIDTSKLKNGIKTNDGATVYIHDNMIIYVKKDGLAYGGKAYDLHNWGSSQEKIIFDLLSEAFNGKKTNDNQIINNASMQDSMQDRKDSITDEYNQILEDMRNK